MEGTLVKQGSFLDAVKTVLAGFLGVRRKADHERSRVSLLHVVVVALALVAAFVFTLVTVVRIVTG